MEIRRKVKNVVYKYSEPERLVREATSNDPWGPTSTVMSELAELSYDSGCCEEMMTIIWKRLNDKGKNWRHVYKCLILLDYLIKCGDHRVATLCMNSIHCIETLKDFQYFEEHKDLGFGVREKSKALVSLLKDDEVLNMERQKGQKIKEKFQGPRSALGSHQRRRPGDLGKEIRRQSFDKELKFHKPVMKLNFDESKHEDEDADLQRAIALSKEEHELSMKKRMEEDFREEMKIKMALEQSKKEDEALAVLRLPPKSSDLEPSRTLLTLSTEGSSQKQTLYQLSETSRGVLDDANGFGDLVGPELSTDPWGSPTPKNVKASDSLDFDPWKTTSEFSQPSFATISDSGNLWGNQKSTVPNKNIIHDIFGDEKPNIQFENNWSSNNGARGFGDDNVEKVDHFLDLWGSEPRATENIGFSKNMTGSLASLTDLGMDPPEEKMQHSCSVMNLAANRTKKTPQEFLGENAKLVNLDNLLPAPKAAQKNPFGSSSAVASNPFNSQTIQIKKPMNQMGPGAPHGNMFSSSGNLNSANMNFNYNTFSQMPQPVIPNSQSQYHVLPTNSTPFNSGGPLWTPQQPLIPSHQWVPPNNNGASNPFFN